MRPRKHEYEGMTQSRAAANAPVGPRRRYLSYPNSVTHRSGPAFRHITRRGQKLTTASGPRRSRREPTPKESWGVKDRAGTSDWTGGRAAGTSERNVRRDRIRQHLVDAPLVYHHLAVNRRRRKRTTMTGTLRAGTGGANWARSAAVKRRNWPARLPATMRRPPIRKVSQPSNGRRIWPPRQTCFQGRDRGTHANGILAMDLRIQDSSGPGKKKPAKSAARGGWCVRISHTGARPLRCRWFAQHFPALIWRHEVCTKVSIARERSLRSNEKDSPMSDPPRFTPPCLADSARYFRETSAGTGRRDVAIRRRRD